MRLPTLTETDPHARLSPSSLEYSRKMSQALALVKLPKLRGLIVPKGV